jgi:hypothetical protein
MPTIKKTRVFDIYQRFLKSNYFKQRYQSFISHTEKGFNE